MFRISRVCCLSLVAVTLAFVMDGARVSAAPTPEHRKALSEIQKEVAKVATLIRKKEYEEAEKTLEDLNSRTEKLVTEAQFPPTDKTVASLKRLIDTNRQRVAKALEKPDPTLISFAKQVAPLLEQRCSRCHAGANARGNLDLSSYAAMGQGGQNGALLIPGSAARSLMLGRVATPNAQLRMPKGGASLTATEIGLLAQWVDQGAKFDGADPTTPLADLGKAADDKKPMPEVTVVVNKATGDEKVSFVRDIAPTIVNLCIGCHNANAPRSGLSLVTFEGMMKGGDSGRVVLPGNLEGSRLWALVGAGEQPRMPQGQARITRKFHADLRVWIEEGAKFDGGDAKAPLRGLVPTEEDKAMERLAALSPDEFRQMRQDRTEEQWKKAAPRSPARFVVSDEFLVYGDVSEDRLRQVSQWAGQQASEMKNLFGINSSPMFKGRLTIFVTKDRFGYTEFNQVIQQRSTPKDMHGHANVTTGFEDAFIVVEDIGDEPGETHGGLQLSVVDHLTGAWLKQPGTSLPDWLIRGTGLALAANAVGENAYISGLKEQTLEALQGIQKPEDVFADGRFGPGQVGPVGYSIVKFMIKAGGGPKFGRMIGQLQSGSNLAAAVKAVYQTDLKQLATAYGQDLG